MLNHDTRIIVVSAFRNSPQHQMERWVKQVRSLAAYFTSVDYVAVEGDSATPHTRVYLESVLPPGHVIHYSHGGRVHGSTEHPDRMRDLSGVGNAMLDAADAFSLSKYDAVLYVESDLIWTGLDIARLHANANAVTDCCDPYDAAISAISPLVMAGEHFYDVWAYRARGHRFSPFEPYIQPIPYPYTAYRSAPSVYPIDSMGSCILMTADLARDRRVRMVDGGALVEWSTRAREVGYNLAVDTSVRINHPT